MKLVFVSSTFKDMQFERDALQTYAIPTLDGALQEYGERAYFGDLRWGVNTTDLDSDEGSKKVLQVCLDQIDSCKPYMIVLVGERYGWIPAQRLLDEACTLKGIERIREISVTELEIDYGALLNPEYEGRILFYFRELDKSGMEEEELKDYEAESPLHAQKMADLKARIQKVYPNHVRTYHAKWDKENKKVTRLEGFLEQVQSDLSAILMKDLEALNEIPWQERCMQSAKKWFEEKRCYLVDEFEESQRYEGALCHCAQSCIYFVGGEGTGKSARLINEFCKFEEAGWEKIAFCFGLDKFSNDGQALAQVIVYKMEQMLGKKHQETVDCDDGAKRIVEYVKALKKRKQSLLICVDGCGESMITLLAYLEKYAIWELGSEGAVEFGKTLRFAMAMGIDLPYYPFFPTSRVYELQPLDKTRASRVLDGIVRSHHKELSEAVKERIISKPQSGNAAYLKSIVKRLLILDSEDFAAIRAMGDGMDNINEYMISLVDQTSDERYGVYLELIDEAKDRIDAQFVDRLTSLFAYCSVGLSIEEIKELFAYLKWEYSDLNFALSMRMLEDVVSCNLSGYYKVKNTQIEGVLRKHILPVDLKAVAEFMLQKEELKQFAVAPAITDGDHEFISSVIKRSGVSSIANEIKNLVERGEEERAVELILYLSDVKEMRHVATVPQTYEYSLDFMRQLKDHPTVHFLNLLAIKSGEKLGIFGKSVQDGAPVLKTEGEKLLFEYSIQAEIAFAEEMIFDQPQLAHHSIVTLYYHIYHIEGYYDYQTVNKLCFVALKCLVHINSKEEIQRRIGGVNFLKNFVYRTEYEKKVLKMKVLWEYCSCLEILERTEGEYQTLLQEAISLAENFTYDGIEQTLTEEDYLYLAKISGDYTFYYSECRALYPRSLPLLTAQAEGEETYLGYDEDFDEKYSVYFTKDLVYQNKMLFSFKPNKVNHERYIEAIASYLFDVQFGQEELDLTEEYFTALYFSCEQEKKMLAWEREEKASLEKGDNVAQMQGKLLDKIRYGVSYFTYATLIDVGYALQREGYSKLLELGLNMSERDDELCSVIWQYTKLNYLLQEEGEMEKLFSKYSSIREKYIYFDRKVINYLDEKFEEAGYKLPENQ